MDDWSEMLNIGCAGDEPWDEMHVPGQCVLSFGMQLEGEGDDGVRDYRQVWASLWRPFLNERGLSACASLQMSGGRKVMGLIWRQIGRVSVGSVTDEEIGSLWAILMASREKTKGFYLVKRISGETRHDLKRVRRWRIWDGVYEETDLTEDE